MMHDDDVSGVDWDSRAPEVRADHRAAFDSLRGRCPVARDAAGTWMLLRHEDVCRAALDAETFSSAASRFQSAPNSMDGDQHRRFGKLVDAFLERNRIGALVPTFREVAEQVVAGLPRGVTIDAIEDLGLLVAVRSQSRWLGWPAAFEQTLCAWVRDNHEATRSGELARTRAISARFDEIVRQQMTRCRAAASSGTPGLDVTAELMRTKVEDPAAPGGERLLTESETISVLRNWTAGDLGSVARAIGVVMHYVAAHAELQAKLRRDLPDVGSLDLAIDEMLRMDDPFVLNRRMTTREVDIGGRAIPHGGRVLLNWTAANRDPAVFGAPDAYRPEQNAKHNLVYGIGPHACPGRALATHELREALTAVLRATSAVQLSPNRVATRETLPLGGYASVPIVLT
jgi:cytochrome P450